MRAAETEAADRLRAGRAKAAGPAPAQPRPPEHDGGAAAKAEAVVGRLQAAVAKEVNCSTL